MDEVNLQSLGQRIKSIRVNRKETLEEFANQIKKKTDFTIKTTKSNVSKWEKGLNIPNDITLKAIAELGNTTADELLAPPLEKLISQYLDELMKFEISQGDQKYKILYDPSEKYHFMEYLLKQDYSNSSLDYGVKYFVKELTEKYLTEKEKMSRYQPYSNKNGVNYLYDELDTLMLKTTEYFKRNDLSIQDLRDDRGFTRNFLLENEIKDSLSYEVYSKLYDPLETLQNKLRNIDIED